MWLARESQRSEGVLASICDTLVWALDSINTEMSHAIRATAHIANCHLQFVRIGRERRWPSRYTRNACLSFFSENVFGRYLEYLFRRFPAALRRRNAFR